MKHYQQLSIMIIFLIAFSSITKINSTKTKSKSHSHSHSHSKLNLKAKSKINLKTNSQSKQVIFQAWGHYYHQSNVSIKTAPINFFQNNEFSKQRIKMTEKDKNDEFGKLAIPEKSSYYIVLYKHSVSFFSARNKIERKNMDSFLLEDIGLIPEDNLKLGGVKDLGKINQYFCINVQTSKTNRPSNVISGTSSSSSNEIPELWSICFDNEETKRKLLSYLIKMKIDFQRENNIFITANQIKSDDDEESKEEDSNSTIEDGRLVLLQDWSECTLKCGGGKTYQQYMCIPPKNGGAPCDKELIKSKDCNIQPCPLSLQLAESKDSSQDEIKKPIIKIGPFSQKHNKYSKCIIKEGEGFRLELDEDTSEYNKIPSKFLMNDRTFSIYEDDTYTKLVYSFLLEKTSLKKEKEFCEFTLNDNSKTYTLRGFEQSCGSVDENKFVTLWNHEFLLFKNECQKGRENVLIDKEEQKKIEDLAKRSSQLLSYQKQNEEAEKVRTEFSSNQQSLLSQNLVQTKKTGLKAIDKEAEIENMIIQEEKEREALELSKIENKIKQEKQKAESFSQSIKEKELDDVFIESERESEAEVFEAKVEAQQKIESKRNNLQEKIAQMRKLSKVKKNQMMNKLKKAKTTLASKVMKAMKEGSSQMCNLGKIEQNISVRESYCNNAFSDDFFLNNECKELENFCYTCCENEFGNIHLDKREDCYNECDGLRASTVNTTTAATSNETEKKKIKWLWKNEKRSDE